MKIITCAGYFATGSSAVTDFFSEFGGVSSLGWNEYGFIQDPDGIADLEYHIVENNHRHNTSYAIKRYLKLIKSYRSFAYGGCYQMYGKEFDRLTEEFINEITQLQVKTWWHRDRVDKGELFCVVDRAYSLIKRVFTNGLRNEKKYSLLTGREDAYYSAISGEEFVAAAKKYIRAVIDSVKEMDTEYIMVDQIIPPINTDRFLKYFDDIKLIVVERDPRDVYLWERSRIHWGVIPTENVEEYVKWFEITRKYSRPQDEDTSKVLRIQFEDLIYKYEETTRKMAEFVGISMERHIAPFTKLIPEKSKNNTNLKQRVNGYKREISYIEDNLENYLYQFPRE